MSTALDTTAAETDSERTQELYDEALNLVRSTGDRVTSVVLVIEWIAAILFTAIHSPLTWAGTRSSLHPHVALVLIVGGLITAFPVLLARARPGATVTRIAMAVAQMSWGALFIHVTGGRIETHFHVFASLAFLFLYRDWRVLLAATLTVCADHITRGVLIPQSVYGIPNPEWWRFLEHAFWVVLEDAALGVGLVLSLRQMRLLASRQAELERTAADIEARVQRRTQQLHERSEEFRQLVETTKTIPWTMTVPDFRVTYVGPQAQTLLGCTLDDVMRPGFLAQRIHPEDLERTKAALELHLRECGQNEVEYRLRKNDGTYAWVRNIYGKREHESPVVRGVLLDITERRQLELELQAAQKLESVGRLAAGVAHEINTPVQFVNDSVHFLRDSVGDLLGLLSQYAEFRGAALEGKPLQELAASLAEAEDTADVEYLREQMPRAIDRAVEGLSRVAEIVRSMKAFAHPDQKERTSVDLNKALATTITIARNEYKYVADVETSFDELPLVSCHAGEVNQVFLNIIVNAAHAIGDKVKGTDQRGKIKVATRVDGDMVCVSISDTGGGIPEHVRGKIFDPFFTTKEIGRGTGQGLAIARSVVEKHDGKLGFDTVVGAGTTFNIRLPIEARAARKEAA
ncbi:MAG: PAS domain-containing protein [Deltaproteobacteria bacterium]|nr:PAS domain-containing protein [Deltaproteobacteria bacterium]